MHLFITNNLISNFKLYDLLIYFVIYSFLGWCIEVGYAYKNQRKFVNRGFLFGPLCPIYGACVLSVVLILENFQVNLFEMLIIATILTSFVEYFTGLILEKLFNTKYWDYTEDPLNLHGRICLHFSMMWGALCLVILKIVHPSIVSLVNNIPANSRAIIAVLLFFYFLIDFTATLNSLGSFKNTFYHTQVSNNTLSGPSPIYKDHIQNLFSDIKEKLTSVIKR